MKEGYRRQQIVQHEAKPQGGPERQPLPDVLDVLERRAQLYESRRREVVFHPHKHSREYLALRKEHIGKMEQLGDEVASLYPNWEPRDQLIFDLYTTLKPWRFGSSAQDTQAFIARVQSPPMTEDELREEIHKAQEAEERKAAIGRKIQETHRLNKNLTPEERWERFKENEAKRSRCKGLQSKWLRTAIIAFLGPDYLPLSISPGPDYLPLRLQSTAWDCNQRCWDHIICNSTPSPFSARPSGR
jgi:hypothetical protein